MNSHPMWPPAQQQAPTWPAQQHQQLPQQQQAPSWPAQQQQPPSLPPQQQPPTWPPKQLQQQPPSLPPQQQPPTWPTQQQPQSQALSPPQQQQQQQASSWPAQNQAPTWPAQYNELPPPPPPPQSFQQNQLPPPPPTNQPSHNLPSQQLPQQHQMQSPPGRSGYMPPSHHAGPYPNQAHPPVPKLNPHSMPSVAQLINDEIEQYKKTDMQLKFTAPATLPPLVATLESQQLQISLHDEGCVRPCHMRSTIYQVPVSKDILDTSAMEFAVLVKPFDDAEVEGKFYVPVSPNEIVRCNRCKAYVNPFSKNGQCCICNFSSSRGHEMDQRPELHLGSYEFRVTEEYYRDKIAECRRPHIIFAIETTAHSVHMINYISKNLAEVIRSHCPKDFGYASTPTPLIGFITFNSKITLHNVREGYQDYVIADTNSILTPISKFLVDPAEHFDDIEKFLATLPEICNDQLEQQAVLGPVIEIALKSCGKDTSNFFETKKTPNQNVIPAGKVYVMMSSLPNAGDENTPGRLSTVRNIDELKKSLGTDNESKSLAPEGKYYTQLAQRCINDYASGVELFLVPPHPRAYLNIATLSELTRLTGTGSINKYLPNSLDNFLHDLKVSLRSTMAFDASMRVRTSTGISPVRYIGNFNNVSGPNLEMSAVNTSSNFIVQMKYDDKLGENDLVVIQFAMIYTSICGERRVRVHNLALNTCSNLADLYKSACCDTLVNYLVRDTVEKLRFSALSSKVAKEQLTSRVVSILAGYRKHCTDSQANNISQLILPEGLKLLPVYLCGALKCDAIDGGIEMFPDDKILAQLNLLGASPSTSQVTIYPRMYAINAINNEIDTNNEQDQMQQVQLQSSANGLNPLDEYGYAATLTRCFRLAVEENRGQCYILENGHYLFIFFPSTESGQKFLSEVYGVRRDDPEISWQLRQTESNETKFLEKLIERIVLERRRALKITVVRQGKDKLEQVFNSFLYEDKKRHEAVTNPVWINANYVEILCFLHAEIRAKMSQ